MKKNELNRGMLIMPILSSIWREELVSECKEMYTGMDLRYIYWELSNYCNLHCKQCYAKANSDAATIVNRETLFNAVSKMADAGVPAIRFGGGEPLMVPYLYDLLEFCHLRGIYVDLTSNGTLLNEATIQKLSLLGLREITISIDGLEKTHDYMRGQGVYSRLQKILDYIVKIAGFQVSIGYTVTSINYREIRDFVEIAYNKGIRKFYFFRYCGDNNRDLLALKIDQLRSASETICNISLAFRDAKFNREASSFYPFLITEDMCVEGCNFLKGILTINYHGDVIVCAAINRKLGNVYTDELESIWERINNEQTAIREIPTECFNCANQGACHGGCKSESYFRYKNYLSRDPLCFLATERISKFRLP